MGKLNELTATEAARQIAAGEITADMPTENGSPLFQGRRTNHDAACVAALRAAGAIIMGKTVTTELANLNPSKTRNPHNLEHTPGGSSAFNACRPPTLTNWVKRPVPVSATTT